jgi:hypothetical protein
MHALTRTSRVLAGSAPRAPRAEDLGRAVLLRAVEAADREGGCARALQLPTRVLSGSIPGAPGTRAVLLDRATGAADRERGFSRALDLAARVLPGSIPGSSRIEGVGRAVLLDSAAGTGVEGRLAARADARGAAGQSAPTLLREGRTDRQGRAAPVQRARPSGGRAG